MQSTHSLTHTMSQSEQIQQIGFISRVYRNRPILNVTTVCLMLLDIHDYPMSNVMFIISFGIILLNKWNQMDKLTNVIRSKCVSCQIFDYLVGFFLLFHSPASFEVHFVSIEFHFDFNFVFFHYFHRFYSFERSFKQMKLQWLFISAPWSTLQIEYK